MSGVTLRLHMLFQDCYEFKHPFLNVALATSYLSLGFSPYLLSDFICWSWTTSVTTSMVCPSRYNPLQLHLRVFRAIWGSQETLHLEGQTVWKRRNLASMVGNNVCHCFLDETLPGHTPKGLPYFTSTLGFSCTKSRNPRRPQNSSQSYRCTEWALQNSSQHCASTH